MRIIMPGNVGTEERANGKSFQSLDRSVSFMRQTLQARSRMRDYHASSELSQLISSYQIPLVSSLLNGLTITTHLIVEERDRND
jgi:hypothetical protein